VPKYFQGEFLVGKSALEGTRTNAIEARFFADAGSRKFAKNKVKKT